MPLLVDTVIPFTAEGPVDLGALRAHALWLLANGAAGFAPAASEFLTIDRKEKERIVEVIADVAAGRPVLANIWDPSPAWCVRLGRQAQDAGATAVLLPPPLLFPVSTDAVVDWYRAVAAAVPLPVIAWHNPRFGNGLGAQACARLLTDTSVAGWLDASGDLHRIRRLAATHPGRTWAALDDLPPTDLEVLSRIPELLGGISRAANVWPELIVRAWSSGELGQAAGHRSSVLQRSGGAAAIRHLLGMHGRAALDHVDATELDRLPRPDFRL